MEQSGKTIKQSAASAGRKIIKTVEKGADKTAEKSVKTAEQTAKTAIKTSQQAAKTASVTARVQPEIKKQAEAVLDKLGLPVSVLIDTLYRQIIMTGGVPFPLAVPKLPARDALTASQFNSMLETGYNQALSGEGLPAQEAFEKIRKGI